MLVFRSHHSKREPWIRQGTDDVSAVFSGFE